MPIWLLTGLFHIRSMLGGTVSWIAASATHLLIAYSALATAWGLVGWHENAKHKRVIQSTEIAYKNAQKEATAKQMASDLAYAHKFDQIAREADSESIVSQAKAVDAIAAYAASHRVRYACGSPPGPTLEAPVPDPAPVDNGASQSPGMVALSDEDYQRLTKAAMRAADNRNWSIDLINAGLAVPEVEFSQ